MLYFLSHQLFFIWQSQICICKFWSLEMYQVIYKNILVESTIIYDQILSLRERTLIRLQKFHRYNGNNGSHMNSKNTHKNSQYHKCILFHRYRQIKVLLQLFSLLLISLVLRTQTISGQRGDKLGKL